MKAGCSKLLNPFTAYQDCTSCGSLAARKWRENEKIKRKWRENEEMERKWRENGEMKRDSLSTFPHFLFNSRIVILNGRIVILNGRIVILNRS